MINYEIKSNKFLNYDVSAYSHQIYTRYGKEGNPDFINTLKNAFSGIKIPELLEAKSKVEQILLSDIPKIAGLHSFDDYVIICVPRSKRENQYYNSQQYFREAVSSSSRNLNGATDGSKAIKRVVETKTTHLSKSNLVNNGEMPYVGITADTCELDKKLIEGRNVILIDDVYTPTINIDEDCIQFLIDNGAANIVFYSIGKTGEL